MLLLAPTHPEELSLGLGNYQQQLLALRGLRQQNTGAQSQVLHSAMSLALAALAPLKVAALAASST
jgi:hypothetical protein